MGLVLTDTHRLPGFSNRGETLQLNPSCIATAKSIGDPLESAAMWYIATIPDNFDQYGIEPAGKIPLNNKWTPVDVLIGGLRLTLLHNVSFITLSLYLTYHY